MSKKDFVTAWILAARTNGNHTLRHMMGLIDDAEAMWEYLENLYETDSRTKD